MRRGLGWSGQLVIRLMGLWAVLAPWCGVAQLQVRPRAYTGVNEAGNAETVEAALRGMTEQAAVVFVGTVVGIKRTAGQGFGAAQGVVEVQFAVEQPVRGVTGGSYTLREWGGLWSATDQRYKVGSRLLMLLHAPSATGLSSPVGGMDGAVPIKGNGQRVGAEDGGVGGTTAMVDLRWIAAKLARTVSYSAAKPAAQAGAKARTSLVEIAPEVAAGNGGAEVGEQSTPAAQASVDAVLAMMSGWQQGGANEAR